MKKNLLFLQSLVNDTKQNVYRNLLLVISFFISSNIFSQNPLLLKEVIPGGAGRSIQKIVSTTSGKTFFNTIDNNNHFSALWGLWTTNGTQAGTNKLILTSPPYPGDSNPGGFISTEATLLATLGTDKIIFAGDDEQGYGEVWVSDGTQNGTFVLEQFFGSSSTGAPVSNITAMGNNVVYSVITNDNKLQLHKTDGTYTGTSMIYDFGLYTDKSVSYFKTIGSLVYFELNNNTTTHNEIWRTDGTAAGTYQVKDLGLNYGFASDFMSFGNNIYFITISSTFGDYIWKSDGTNAGTAPLKQISTTVNFDNVFPSYAATSTALYFAANNSINGKEIWQTDGTVGGTAMFIDLNAGSTGSNPNLLTIFKNQLYFTADARGGLGDELYHYDGTFISAGDIFQGPTGSNPSNLTVQNNTLLFSATRNTIEGNELWVRDSTNFNGVEIANINPVANVSSNPSLISVSGNSAYFAASFDANGDGIYDNCIYKYSVPQKIWTGNVNTDGSNIDNWFPQGVPANGDNLLFPVNPVNNFSNPFLFCNDFINNGSAINVNSGLCLISGNFYNAGTINNTSGGGVFAVVGNNTNAIRDIGSPGFFNGQLTLSGGLNTRLTSNIKVNTLRVEGGDTIYLGPYSFQIDAFNLFIPKVVTDSSGRFIMPVGSSPVTFPVMADTKSYTPVTISNAGVVDYFAVNVKNDVLKNGTTGDTVMQQVVNKTWNIFEALSGGSNATITAQWNAADELTGFNRNNVYLNHYTSGAWDSGTPGIASGSGPYTFTRNGFASFSPFSISSSTSALPVTLISFSANKINNAIQLNWQTSSEKNISFYNIEKSKDGNVFEKMDALKAFQNSSANNYSYTDKQPLQGTNFYRLKIIDADGKFTYSKIVAIKMDDKNITLQIFPNPAKNLLNVQVNGNNESITLQIIDMTGRKVKEEKIQLNGNTSVSVDINNLPKGTYNLLLKSKSINEQKKFVKE
jgi:trimeric autotransporter adhesin